MGANVPGARLGLDNAATHSLSREFCVIGNHTNLRAILFYLFLKASEGLSPHL